MRVEADRSVCAASGQCVMAAAAVFAQGDDDGVVIVLDATPGPALRDAVVGAAQRCPTQAIRVVDEDDDDGDR